MQLNISKTLVNEQKVNVNQVDCGLNRFIHQFPTVMNVKYDYGSIPINTIFSGMNIHFNPAILM
jgi:hypothetical protein